MKNKHINGIWSWYGWIIITISKISMFHPWNPQICWLYHPRKHFRNKNNPWKLNYILYIYNYITWEMDYIYIYIYTDSMEMELCIYIYTLVNVFFQHASLVTHVFMGCRIWSPRSRTKASKAPDEVGWGSWKRVHLFMRKHHITYHRYKTYTA